MSFRFLILSIKISPKKFFLGLIFYLAALLAAEMTETCFKPLLISRKITNQTTMIKTICLNAIAGSGLNGQSQMKCKAIGIINHFQKVPVKMWCIPSFDHL